MVRIAGRLVLGAAGLGLVVVFLVFTFGGFQRPDFHNYGVVHTRLGIAAVACGGETSRGCGVDTAIRFAACSPRFHEYFGRTDVDGDHLVRRLIGKRPPSGDRWVVECGGAGGMIQNQPRARLDPS